MVYVPAGEFTMGRDDIVFGKEVVHPVYLDAFWIDQTEVTNGMYAKCVTDGGCMTHTSMSYSHGLYYGNPAYDNYPVIHVSWDRADKYCSWANRRLPTEAEWEKAASWDEKKGIKHVYPWGDTIDCTLANYKGKDNGCVGDTTPVGSYQDGQSTYGAFDMAGNVWEWVSDWWDPSYYEDSPYLNPQGPNSGTLRVVRGGSWGAVNTVVGSADRTWFQPSMKSDSIGFRCALSE